MASCQDVLSLSQPLVFFDIFLRLDLAKCVCCSISGSSKDDQCKPPTDSEIIKYCLGKNDDAPVVTMHVWPCQCQ